MFKQTSLKKHILLVEDDKSLTKILTMLLETRGYAVEVVHTGQDALKRASPNTDLILLDRLLPDAEGFEVCKRIKREKQTQHIPIIMVSAKILSGDVAQGLYLGADDYVAKPIEFEELIARMEAVMRRSALFPSEQFTSTEDQAILSELYRIIKEEALKPVFQPIVHLESNEIIGFEALMRPQTTSALANPELLFKKALQFGVYQKLELLSWRKIIEYAETSLKDKYLFLNCSPYLIEGENFLEIQSLFAENNIKIQNIVLELTERSSVSAFETFTENLSCYRDLGLRFAIDDVGGGYASLEAIVNIKPDIVKIDRHIVQGLENDPFKQSVIKFMSAFCKENNMLSIAEGIETKEELQALRQIGINAGQGYLLSRPAPEIDFLKIEENLRLVSPSA